MYYDLELFGKEVLRIRNNLNLTQNDVSILTGVNTDTLRKIENGKVIPKQETLDFISIALKKDLNTILLKYRLHDYNKLDQLKNIIENKLKSGKFSDLKTELDKLNELISYDMNSYFYKLGKQLYLLVEAIILKTNNHDFSNALNKLIESMKITITDFSVSNYKNFSYNEMEIRILMNIAITLNTLESKNKYLEILLFCLNELEPNESELKIKIYYNISYAYHKLDSHENTLYYSIKGIDICVENNNLSCLGLLHYRKGIAEYFLEKECYMDSLRKSVSIYELSGQHKLKNMLIDSCKSFYGIIIE